MSNQDQIDYWNGDAGRLWVAFSDRLDAMLLPFAELTLRIAEISPHEDVLDIGCGAGALSLMAAQAGKSVLGVDISQPLIDLATQRSQTNDKVHFARFDAAEITLEKKRDVILSRFGVMFFSDPVSAFANIRRQTKKNGRMVFACWQSTEKNLWARAPIEAAMPFFKEAPIPPEPNALGPFAFADSEYLTDILMDAGWRTVELTDWTGDIRLPGVDAREAAIFMMEMGPLSKIMKEQHLDYDGILAALADNLNRLANEDGAVEMQASVFIVEATQA